MPEAFGRQSCSSGHNHVSLLYDSWHGRKEACAIGTCMQIPIHFWIAFRLLYFSIPWNLLRSLNLILNYLYPYVVCFLSPESSCFSEEMPSWKVASCSQLYITVQFGCFNDHHCQCSFFIWDNGWFMVQNSFMHSPNMHVARKQESCVNPEKEDPVAYVYEFDGFR